MSVPKVYIVSTGRSGTTFLYRFFLKYYPDFQITHQTRWSRVINILGNFPVRQKFKIRLLLTAFKILKHQQIPVTTLDPLLSLPIAEMLDQNSTEKIKIIHLVRHPKDFVISFLYWKSTSFSKIILHNFIPFWQPSALFNGVGFIKWCRMSKYNKFCWTWNFKNAKFHSLSKDYDYLLLKLEDLTNEGSKAAWDKMINFIGLPHKEIDYDSFIGKRINKSDKNKTAKRKYTEDKLKALCQSYCGSLADTLGYKI